MKNWKTTLGGVVGLTLQVLPVLLPNVITHDVATALTVIAIAAGLIAAKDGNVTGGTVKQ